MRGIVTKPAILLGVVLAAASSSWCCRAIAAPSPHLVPRPVLKLVIDHPELAKYLHPETDGRVPLVISDHLLAPGVTPSKFGQPVQIVPDRQLGSRPHLRFLSFDVDGSRAKAVIEYKVEGVQAVFDMASTSSGWWKVLDAKISEH